MAQETERRDENSNATKGVIAAGLTDVGKVRDQNEDAFALCNDLGLFIVSDGMGGHESGEVASDIVAKVLPMGVAKALEVLPSPDATQLASILRQAIGDISLSIQAQISAVPSLHGMGATVAACLTRGPVAAIAHMGDSRVYLMRGGMLERLTEDHNVVGLLLQLGRIDRGQAKGHPGQHVLTRYLGMDASLGPDVHLLDLRNGDRLLLCSDGLTNMVNDREIGDILWRELDLKACCRRLVDAANDAGGDDNTTVVILQYGKRAIFGEGGSRKRVLVRRVTGYSLREAAFNAVPEAPAAGTRELDTP
jgi:protein phosphatase